MEGEEGGKRRRGKLWGPKSPERLNCRKCGGMGFVIKKDRSGNRFDAECSRCHGSGEEPTAKNR